ncbi:MAG: GMP/IMP nucleotidase [Cellvibrionaceae bacterium]|nr:GMP/IMP nucleotidase [Cellvibrionaceae bacterium]
MIEWQTIDTVLLDMDGTLLDLHYDNHFWLTHLPKRYAEIKGISIHESEKKLHDHIHTIEGTLNWYCLDYWSKTLDIDVPALKQETCDRIAERPYALDFLKFLQRHNKTVYLVTNSHPTGIRLKFTATHIEPYFDRVISSHQFQQPKEVTGFWQKLHQHLHFDLNRTLFIDDNLKVLNTAKTFGIQYILGIHQPDSRQQRRLNTVPAIHHFNDIMPNE